MIATCVKTKLIINAKTMDIDHRILAILEKIEALDYTVLVVGGFVRDTLLNKVSKDYDLATNAPLDVLSALFTIEHTQSLKVSDQKIHTVSKILFEGLSVEITQFREETYDENYNLMDVKFVNDFKDDVSRRDFTINALAYNKNIIDEVGGLKDLKEGVIRSIIDPEVSFQEDPSRMIRALRFMGTLNFDLSKKDHTALLKHRQLILKSKNLSNDLKLLLKAVHFDKVYETYPEVFSILSNGKYQNIALDNRRALDSDLILLGYLIFEMKLNYDNTIFKHINFSLKDKKFILSIKPLVRELMLPLTQSDIILLYIAYGQNTMLRAYDILKDLNVVNELNLMNIKKVFVEGYLKIDEIALSINDLNDSYTIKQKYRILKDIQKLIIREQLLNEREELLNFIQNYY